MANKLASWKEKLLSNAGKEILIKVVAQAVPAYTMSCFKFPNTLWWIDKNGETVLVGTKEARKEVSMDELGEDVSYKRRRNGIQGFEEF